MRRGAPPSTEFLAGSLVAESNRSSPPWGCRIEIDSPKTDRTRRRRMRKGAALEVPLE